MKPVERWTVLLLLATALAVGAGAGCGKKGPPSVPKKTFSAEVQNLSGSWDGDYILLQGDLKGISSPDEARELALGSRVYYGAYDPDEPPCEGCPVRYHGYHEFGVEVLTEQGFICKVPGKRKDAVYFMKVHIIGPDGELGPASNRVRVEGSAP